MLIPIGTDAPIYHWPYATLGLIVTNIVTFVITGFGSPENQDVWHEWMLEYGQGLHPLQWVSTNFLHYGFMHLLLNMIFLWGFGIIVEGKLGWWRFLLLYFGIGFLRAAIEQTIMLGHAAGEGAAQGSGGASGIIYGLMAISLIWAPRNEISIFYLFIFGFMIRVFTFEVTILSFSLFYIGTELLSAWLLRAFTMSSEILHLLGAGVGFAVGLAFLKLQWVDCENWDLLSIMSGRHLDVENEYEPYRFRNAVEASAQKKRRPAKSKSKPKKSRDEADNEAYTAAARQAKTLAKMDRFLKAGKANSALAEYDKLKQLLADWQLPERDLLALIDGLVAAEQWEAAVRFLEEFIARFPDKSTYSRVRLGDIFVHRQRRPQAALKAVNPLSADDLQEPLRSQYEGVCKSATELIDAGVIELDGRSW